MKLLIDALDRRGLVPRGPRALGEGADRRLRAPRRARRSGSSPTSRSRRAACCSSTPPTRPRASSGPATPSTSRCSSSPTCPGFMIGTAGRAPGDHPPRREDDQRGLRGDRAEALGDRPQGLRRRALRDGRAGLRARRCIALPRASIAVMGPQAAINAVFFNQLQAIEDEAERAAKTEELRSEYAEDIDILHLASELVVDAVVEPEDLRAEIARRFAHAATSRATGRRSATRSRRPSAAAPVRTSRTAAAPGTAAAAAAAGRTAAACPAADDVPVLRAVVRVPAAVPVVVAGLGVRGLRRLHGLRSRPRRACWPSRACRAPSAGSLPLAIWTASRPRITTNSATPAMATVRARLREKRSGMSMSLHRAVQEHAKEL